MSHAEKLLPYLVAYSMLSACSHSRFQSSGAEASTSETMITPLDSPHPEALLATSGLPHLASLIHI